jgi:flagellar motor protein MotB
MDNGFGMAISNEAVASVRITADPDIDETTIVGKVFDDRDGDGFQDPGIATGVFIQGGFDSSAYVENSTTIDTGEGPVKLSNSNLSLATGINVGQLTDRINFKAAAPKVVIRQQLRDASSLSDILVTTAEGSRTSLTTAGNTFEDHIGDKARGLTAQDIRVARQIVPLENGAFELVVSVSNHGSTEAGIPGVRLATVEGLLVETDAYGRYHLAGIDGGSAERGRNFIVKVDPATLPRGATFTTENPRVMRITGGLMNQFDFGVKMPKAPETTQTIEVKLGEIFFVEGSSEVSPQFAPMIAELGSRLRQSDGGVLTIAGHGECVAPANGADIANQSRSYNLTPHFDSRKAILKSDDEAALRRIINEWRGARNIKVVTTGHTDNIGIAERNRVEYKDNYELSKARANTMAAYLGKELGLDNSQITVIGRGPDSPVASNKTAEGRALNRRVELSITGDFVQNQATMNTGSACTDIAKQRAHHVYTLLKPYLGDDKICNVSFRSGSRTFSPESCGGTL